MEFIKSKQELQEEKLPGRVLYKVVGKDSPIKSQKMTVGFARYSKESGPMEPHHHAEETIYIIRAEKGYIRRGKSKNELEERVVLCAGMMVRFDELEWHVFEYDDDGYVEIIFIYGQVDNIRPEEITKE